jgi:hypothetical protein
MKRTTWRRLLVLPAAGALFLGVPSCGLLTLIDHASIGQGGGGGPSLTVASPTHNAPSTTCPDDGVACGDAGACPTPLDACLDPTCEQGCCGTTFKARGQGCPSGVCDGAGKCVTCDAELYCPAQSTLCVVNECQASGCGTKLASAGTTCKDEGGRVCDGAGKCVACNVPEDCPVLANECDARTCDAHVCGSKHADLGTTCTAGGKVCNGAGTCVGCNGNSDCDTDAGTGACHYTKVCVPPQCADGTKNGAETGIDCGGDDVACPPRCPDSQGCSANGDCQSGFCDPLSHTCG